MFSNYSYLNFIYKFHFQRELYNNWNFKRW